VCYCSEKCQREHWKRGGHKALCGATQTVGTREDGKGASTVPVGKSHDDGDGALQHPCPICLDSEDNTDGFGMCFSCGQMYCGSCDENASQFGVVKCPTCRATLRVSKKMQVQRLQRLLLRPPGRHTPSAQYTLGVFYEEGDGIAKDSAEAARLYRLAADLGHVKAQCNLGAFFTRGHGVTHDDTQAAKWFRLAAEQGDARAQFNLGTCYANGSGVDEDYAEAARLYRLSATQGFKDAQWNFAVFCTNGLGVTIDNEEAYMWYSLAAEQGHEKAQHYLNLLDEVAREIAEGEAIEAPQ
jgi:hypothetical protein